MKRAGVLLTIALFCLSGAGPAAAQTGSPAAMAGPMRAADSPLGLMVSDYVGGKVVFLDPSTLAVQDTLPLPIEGQDPGPILRTRPTGVAYMNQRFYVADERSGSILVYERPGLFKPHGRLETKFKKLVEWTLVAEFAIGAPSNIVPSDIVADQSLGWLFVASRGDRTVYVLDETGAVVRTIGGPASTSPVGQPRGLALDRAGQRLFVSDDGAEACTWMGCAPVSLVHVYDYNENFRGEISGESGADNFKFSRAQGVTVDSTGRVYLVDSWRGQVLVFDEVSPDSWAGVGTFGRRGAGIKELLLPMDVVVDETSSSVYVTDNMMRRVEVFAIEDMVP